MAELKISVKIAVLLDEAKNKLNQLKELIRNMGGGTGNLNLTSNADALKAKILDLKNQLNLLNSGGAGVNLTSNADELKNKIKELERELGNLNRLGGRVNLNSGAGNAGNLGGAAKKAIDETEKSAGVLGATVNRVGSDIKGMLLGALAIGGLVAFTSKLAETVQKIQDLRLRLSGMTNGNTDLANSEAYLTDLSHKHHKSVLDLTASYSSLLILEKSGLTTRQQSIQLLEGMSNAGAALGASNTQIAQSVYGLSQMLGQGVVQAAEFNQTIEPLTGLGIQIAKAFGADTVATLKKWIGEGKITSEMMGQKMPEALKAYAGAAERAGGLISASYNDIGNTYTEMAKELEKPVATAVISVANVGKEAYGWLKDNGNAIINVLTGIAVAMLGKGADALLTYTAAGAKVVLTEQAQLDATLASARADEIARVEKVRLAEVKLLNRNASLATAQADILAADAQLLVARANELATGSASMLVDAEIAQTAATARLTAATDSQAAADTFLTGQNAKLAESQLALTAATNTSTAAMSRIAAAGKSAFALIGGWVGVAVIAIYGLLKVVEKVLDTEGQAADRLMTLTNLLSVMTDQVKALSADEVDIDFSKTTAKIDELKKKLDNLSVVDKVKQYFGQGVGTTLDQELEVQEQRAAALTAKKIADTKEYDATKLAAKDRQKELSETEKTINERLYRIEELKASKGDRHQIGALISENRLYINALEAKHSAIKKVIDAESKTGKVNPEEAKKQAALEEKIRKEQREQALTNIKADEAEKIRIIENSGKSQQQIDEAVFKVKVKSSKAVSAELKKQLAEDMQGLIDHANNKKTLSTEELTTKKDNLKQIEKASKENIDALNALEKDHHDKAVALDKAIKDVKKQGAEGERDIARAGMNEAEVFTDKSKEIAEKKSQYNTLMGKKDYAQAAETAKELQALTKEQAIAAQSAIKEQLQAVRELEAAQQNGDQNGIESASKKLNDANQKVAISPKETQADYKQATELATGALEKQKAEELAKAAEAKKQADLLRITFKQVGDQIAALNETLSKGKTLKILVDTTDIDKAQDKIEGLTGGETKPHSTVHRAFDSTGKAVGFGDVRSDIEGGVKAQGADTIKPLPSVATPQLSSELLTAIKQLKPINNQAMVDSMNANSDHNDTSKQQDKVLGVYRLDLASPAGTVSATIKASDKDVFESYQRYAKSHNRTTREDY